MKKAKNKDLERCRLFLIKNGWKEDTGEDEFLSFHKKNCVSVDLLKDGSEMVFLDGNGDIYHAYVNLYTLVGFLIHHRQIACDYKNWDSL